MIDGLRKMKEEAARLKALSLRNLLARPNE
jgi:hypothetical protein